MKTKGEKALEQIIEQPQKAPWLGPGEVLPPPRESQDPAPTDPPSLEQGPKPASPPGELRLLNLLIRMVEHVAVRNAMGKISKEFCKGCKHGRLKACPLPEALREIGQ